MALPRFASLPGRSLSAALLVLHLLGAAPVGAVPILEIAAGDPDSGSILIAPGTSTQALAAGFELTSAFSDVAISASLTCLQCQVQFYLMADAIGSGSDFVTNVQAVTTIDTLSGGGFIDQPTSLFSGLTLGVGAYYLVMALTNDTISGTVWSATQTPIVTSLSGALNSPDWMALSAGYNSTTPPLSAFQPYEVNATPTWLQFSIDVPGKVPPVAVPEPATGLLLLGGILGLFVTRRRSVTRSS
jgi:hypothetical protein